MSTAHTVRFGTETAGVLQLCDCVGSKKEIETVVERAYVFLVNKFTSISNVAIKCMVTDYAVMKTLFHFMKMSPVKRSAVMASFDPLKKNILYKLWLRGMNDPLDEMQQKILIIRVIESGSGAAILHYASRCDKKVISHVLKRLTERRSNMRFGAAMFGAAQVLWNVIGDKNSMLLKSVLLAHLHIDKKIHMVKWLIQNGTQELRDTCIYCTIVNDMHLLRDRAAHKCMTLMRGGMIIPCARFFHKSRHLKSVELRSMTIDMLFSETCLRTKPFSTLQVLNEISEKGITDQDRAIVSARYDELVSLGMNVTETPLRIALINQCEKSVEFFLSKGISAFFIPLMTCVNADVNLMMKLFDHGLRYASKSDEFLCGVVKNNQNTLVQLLSLKPSLMNFVKPKLLLTIAHFDLYESLPQLMRMSGFLRRAFSFDAIDKMLCSRRKLDSSPRNFSAMLSPVIDHALELRPNRSRFADLYALAGTSCVQKLPLILQKDEQSHAELTVLSEDKNIATRLFTTYKGAAEGVTWLWSHGNTINLENWVQHNIQDLNLCVEYILKNHEPSIIFGEQKLTIRCCIHLPRRAFKLLVETYLAVMTPISDIIEEMLRRNDREVNKDIVETLVRRYPTDFTSKMDARSIAWACVRGVSDDVFHKIWGDELLKTLVCAFFFSSNESVAYSYLGQLVCKEVMTDHDMLSTIRSLIPTHRYLAIDNKLQQYRKHKRIKIEI